MSELIDEVKTIYAVMSNVDLTEGRGKQYIQSYCYSKATALRTGKGKYVMGGDCPISKVDVYKIGGRWKGDIEIVKPSVADKKHDSFLKEIEMLDNKLIEKGFTNDEIKLLKRGGL